MLVRNADLGLVRFVPPQTRDGINRLRSRVLPVFGNGITRGASGLPGGGAGVFTTRAFVKGELLTFVDGPLVTRETLLLMPTECCAWAAACTHQLTAKTHAVVGRHHPRTMHYIAPDEDASGMGGGAFVRDPRASGASANADYVVIDAADNMPFARAPTRAPVDPYRRLIVLRAREDLPRGAEVFVAQGMAYWARPEQNPALQPCDIGAFLLPPMRTAEDDGNDDDDKKETQ